MMKRIKLLGWLPLLLILWVVVSGSTILFSQGLNSLADKVSHHIKEYFSDKYNVKVSIIRFDNASAVSDLTAQKFYQLIVSRLETAQTKPITETSGQFSYIDLMINFNRGKGEFNLNRISPLNHLIYVKLTQNKNKVGAGISIFSRTSDKIVFVKYCESLFPSHEREIFETLRYGFKNAGFSKIVEIDARAQLLDCKSFRNSKGQLRFLFFYPEKIDVFKVTGNRLDKYFSFPLNWGDSYVPVMRKEGKIAVFPTGSRVYVTVGGNFSSFSRVIVIEDDEWKELGNIDFVPLRQLESNQTHYIAGVRYAIGKNYFEGKLLLVPFEDFTSQRIIQEKQSYPFLEKNIEPFYDLDFATVSEGHVVPHLDSVHLVNRQYNYRFLADNFEPVTQEGDQKRGASLCAFDGKWLAVSDYAQGYDTLYFYKIENGSRQLVYQNSISGEIIFITEGLWQAARGFWVCVQLTDNSTATIPHQYKLQFWSKKSD
jgi:hypothetical protein